MPDPFSSTYSSEDENMTEENTQESISPKQSENSSGAPDHQTFPENMDSEEVLEDNKDAEEQEDEEPEFWDDFPDEIFNDIGKDQPLPEPSEKSSITKKLTSLLQWFVLFILLWQANCKISNNGLEWLLRFLFQFLHLVGITCHCDYLVEFCTMFPTSLYVLRQLVEFDRDDFVKFVVCPKCSSLYRASDNSREKK